MYFESAPAVEMAGEDDFFEASAFSPDEASLMFRLLNPHV